MIRAAAVRDSIAKLLYYRLGASQAGDWVVGGGFDSSPRLHKPTSRSGYSSGIHRRWKTSQIQRLLASSRKLKNPFNEVNREKWQTYIVVNSGLSTKMYAPECIKWAYMTLGNQHTNSTKEVTLLRANIRFWHKSLINQSQYEAPNKLLHAQLYIGSITHWGTDEWL